VRREGFGDGEIRKRRELDESLEGALNLLRSSLASIISICFRLSLIDTHVRPHHPVFVECSQGIPLFLGMLQQRCYFPRSWQFVPIFFFSPPGWGEQEPGLVSLLLVDSPFLLPNNEKKVKTEKLYLVEP
jgi:hypothetical protein